MFRVPRAEAGAPSSFLIAYFAFWGWAGEFAVGVISLTQKKRGTDGTSPNAGWVKENDWAV